MWWREGQDEKRWKRFDVFAAVDHGGRWGRAILTQCAKKHRKLEEKLLFAHVCGDAFAQKNALFLHGNSI